MVQPNSKPKDEQRERSDEQAHGSSVHGEGAVDGRVERVRRASILPLDARTGACIALLVMLFAQALDLLWWTASNEERTGVKDVYTYLRRLFAFDLSLEGNNPHALSQLSHKGRPPTYQLLTLPFIRVFGRSEFSALLVNVPFLAVLGAFTYVIGSRLRDWSTGLLAALLVTTYPPALHLARAYTPYYAVFCWSAPSLWALLNACKRPSARSSWVLVAMLAVGISIHPAYVYAFGIPGALAVLYLALSHPALRIHLATAVAICMAPVVWWYLTAGRQLLSIFEFWFSPDFQGSGETTRIFIGRNNLPAMLWYPMTLPETVSIPFCVIGICALVSVLRKRRFETAALGAFCVAGYIALSMTLTLGWSRGALLLVAFGLLSADWVTSLPRRGWKLTATSLCVGACMLNYVHVTRGLPDTLQAVSNLLGNDEPRGNVTTTLALGAAPPLPRSTPLDEVMEVVESTVVRRGATRSNLLVAASWPRPWVEYELFLRRADVRVTSFQQPRWVREYRISYLLCCDDILFEPKPEKNKDWTSYDRATREFLSAPPPLFRGSHERVDMAQFPDLVLWSRVRPWTVAEAKEIRAALDLADEDLHDPAFEILVAAAELSETDLEAARALTRDAFERRAVPQDFLWGLPFSPKKFRTGSSK